MSFTNILIYQSQAKVMKKIYYSPVISIPCPPMIPHTNQTLPSFTLRPTIQFKLLIFLKMTHFLDNFSAASAMVLLFREKKNNKLI